MVKPTGPTNPFVRKTIAELEKRYRKTKIKFFKDLAERINKPRRTKKAVNLSKLNKYLQKGEIAVIPHKLLGYGIIDKKIEVVALNYSKSAKEKIESKGGKIYKILDFIEKAKKPLKLRIIE